MARVYQITEEEMQSLLDQLKMEQMEKSGHFRNSGNWNEFDIQYRAFHYVVCRWAQAMGFKGYRI